MSFQYVMLFSEMQVTEYLRLKGTSGVFHSNAVLDPCAAVRPGGAGLCPAQLLVSLSMEIFQHFWATRPNT